MPRKQAVTIIDIASRAGVSFKTVSRVLNGSDNVRGELRERVEAVIHELGYRPNSAARSLAGSRRFALALLVGTGHPAALDDEEAYVPPYLAEVQRGALAGCREAGYQLVVEALDAGPAADIRRQLATLRVDGVLMTPPLVDDPRVIEALEEADIACVRITPGSTAGRAPAIVIDDRAAALEMTRLLGGLGHRRIAFIGGLAHHLAAGRRRTGYLDGMTELGGEPLLAEGDFRFSSGMRAGLDFLRLPQPPTAIFAANDDMAAGVVAAAHSLGLRVPDAVSVAGFDDSATALMIWPPLTTVRQPIARMARTGVELLVEASRTGDPLPEAARELPFRIVRRESAGPPRVT